VGKFKKRHHRRITRALRRKGVDVARCTVERLMRELGLEGVIRGQRRRGAAAVPRGTYSLQMTGLSGWTARVW
jgi:transposase InsO family protein